MGRKAAHEAKNIADLTLSGKDLFAYEIAYPPADENRPISDTTYQKFESRDAAYKMIWGALVKEDEHPIIGIYGMPGVGKTLMMEKAWKVAKDKKIFTKVTRANLGAGEINVIKVQNELAGYLGCHLDSQDNEVRRAFQLKRSFTEGKTLVVLDDVWGHIHLEKIGIPVGGDLSKHCKVLLTSRQSDTCLLNSCRDPIEVKALTDGEAWDMFQGIVGASKFNTFQNTSLAKEVCDKCGGLPLLILALGNALKFRTEYSWENAVFQLNKCEFDEINGIKGAVCNGIRLSFDMLGKDTKTCLLLSSLFPEDAEIEIMMLADLATGSRLLNYGINVWGLIDELKASSLLLEGKTHFTVKMHDVIRDVARFEAARDSTYAFLFVSGGMDLLPIDSYSTGKLIHIVDRGNFEGLTGMVCPNMHTLWLECNKTGPQQFSERIFRGFSCLKNLIIKGKLIFQVNMPVQTFDKLTTLMLEGFDINEMWLSVAPENLETLRISDCLFTDPLNISRLKTLRKLQVLSGRAIELVPNTISALSPTLVQLYIPRGVIIFDAEGNRLPISSEINELTALKSLNIRLEVSESCPAEHIAANLVEFCIHVGNENSDLFSGSERRSVKLEVIGVEGGGEVLLERAEEVILHHVVGSPNGLSNSNRGSYSTMKKLSIAHCGDMEQLCQIPQFQIQQSQPAAIPFSKLTSLTIDFCDRLKYVFSASVAKCLLQLEELKINGCDELEVVIWNQSVLDGEIILPKLKSLLLANIGRLRRFYGEMETHTSSPAQADDSLFDGTVGFTALEKLSVSHYSSKIWGENCHKNKSFYRLKFLYIGKCPKLEFAIPLAMSDTFKNLEELELCQCDSMISDVESSTNGSPPALEALRSISLSEMDSLTRIGLNSSMNLDHCRLEILSVEKCNRLTNVFLRSTVDNLFLLKELVVKDCDKMTEIIGEGWKEEKHGKLVFPFLTKLVLTDLPNFKSICFNDSVDIITSRYHYSSAPKLFFPRLERLEFHMISESDRIQLQSEWQFRLPYLEKLSLKNSWWPGRSEELNDRQYLINPYERVNFQRLKMLHVNSCGVSALLTSSVFSNLILLQELIVENCPSLEEVVRQDDNYIDIQEITISCLQLKSIELKNLPRLLCFSGSAKYPFDMPALTSVALDQCPKMKNFTFTEIRTPLINDFNTRFQQYRSQGEAAIICPEGIFSSYMDSDGENSS